MRTIYAIGDIHGRLESLDDLLAQVVVHSAGNPSAILLFIGDYVDRGPSSRQVVERIMEIDGIALMGNHEAMMLAALDGSERWTRNWLVNGGLETMASYGCADIETFRKVFPAIHRRFIAALPLSHETEECLFVHAGIDPAVPFDEQERETLLWIREPFLDYRGPLAKRVVHGHTPTLGDVDIRPWRVNVDAGCGKGGRLACAVVEGREVVDVLYNCKVEGF